MFKNVNQNAIKSYSLNSTVVKMGLMGGKLIYANPSIWLSL